MRPNRHTQSAGYWSRTSLTPHHTCIRDCSKCIQLLCFPSDRANTVITILPYRRIVLRTISCFERVDINTISGRIVHHTPYILAIHQRVFTRYRITAWFEFLPHLSIRAQSKLQELITAGISFMEVRIDTQILRSTHQMEIPHIIQYRIWESYKRSVLQFGGSPITCYCTSRL